MALGRLSEQERRYIVSGVQQDVRGDGRSRRTVRHFDITSEPVSNTSGSSIVKMVSDGHMHDSLLSTE